MQAPRASPHTSQDEKFHVERVLLPALTVDAGSDSVCVVPGHAVKAVEIVGGNQLALDALKGGLQGWQIKMGGRQHQQDVFRGFGGFSLTDAMNATKSGVSAAAAASDTSALSASTHAAQQQRARPRFNVEEAERRRLRVKAALEANRIPFEEHIAEPAPMLYVMGTLRLPWPYTAEACQCPNEIVLTRVQALLSSS